MANRDEISDRFLGFFSTTGIFIVSWVSSQRLGSAFQLLVAFDTAQNLFDLHWKPQSLNVRLATVPFVTKT